MSVGVSVENESFTRTFGFFSWDFCQQAGDSIQIVDGKCQISLTPERTKMLELHAEVLAKKALEGSDFCGNLYAELKEGMGCNVQRVPSGDKKFEKGKALSGEACEIVKVQHKVEKLQAAKGLTGSLLSRGIKHLGKVAHKNSNAFFLLRTHCLFSKLIRIRNLGQTKLVYLSLK
jgi:hypothetical protein